MLGLLAVWQFYMGIYIGLFLFLLLAALVVAIPFYYPAASMRDRLGFWFGRVKSAWGVVSEVDGMLLSQELGWATLNGYSGNDPPGDAQAKSCIEAPRRILNYMAFAQITDPAYYLDMIRRVGPVGFTDCDSVWWQAMPSISLTP